MQALLRTCKIIIAFLEWAWSIELMRAFVKLFFGGGRSDKKVKHSLHKGIEKKTQKPFCERRLMASPLSTWRVSTFWPEYVHVGKRLEIFVWLRHLFDGECTYFFRLCKKTSVFGYVKKSVILVFFVLSLICSCFCRFSRSFRTPSEPNKNVWRWLQ